MTNRDAGLVAGRAASKSDKQRRWQGACRGCDVCAIFRRDAARNGATCITALDAGARRAGRAFSEMARGASAGRDAAARDCKRLRRVARRVRAIAGEWASRRGRISRRCPQAARRCACCPEVPAPTIVTAPLLHEPDREV